MKAYDVIEVHMRGNENLREIHCMGLVIWDRRLDTGIGTMKILMLLPEPKVMIIGFGPGYINAVAESIFRAALINSSGYASDLTDVAQWEWPK